MLVFCMSLSTMSMRYLNCSVLAFELPHCNLPFLCMLLLLFYSVIVSTLLLNSFPSFIIFRFCSFASCRSSLGFGSVLAFAIFVAISFFAFIACPLFFFQNFWAHVLERTIFACMYFFVVSPFILELLCRADILMHKNFFRMYFFSLPVYSIWI